MTTELQNRINRYHNDYLDTPAGQKHLAVIETEIQDVQTTFDAILRQHHAGDDITEAVLRHLLPHNDTQHNRERVYRVSNWPCIIKDIRTWFENNGWKTSHDWRPAAKMILEALDGLRHGRQEPWRVSSPL